MSATARDPSAAPGPPICPGRAGARLHRPASDVAVGGNAIGLARLALHFLYPGTKQFSAQENAMYLAGLSRAGALRAMAGAFAFIAKSAFQSRDARSFGDVPLTVIYSGNTRKPEGPETLADVAAWHALTLDRMRALVAGVSGVAAPW